MQRRNVALGISKENGTHVFFSSNGKGVFKILATSTVKVIFVLCLGVFIYKRKYRLFLKEKSTTKMAINTFCQWKWQRSLVRIIFCLMDASKI